MRLPLLFALLLNATVAGAMAQAAPERAGATPIAPALDAAVQAQIDRIVTGALAANGEPGASVAVAREGRIVFAKAYGNARLSPAVVATPTMRYKIGSISKQFVAASMLLLEQDGKLDLDDKVGRYFPALTRAGDISLRQLLNHSAGYPDFYPLDIVTIEMGQSISPDSLMVRYGTRPLEFEPGARWVYSNTNYVIAGRIIEKVSGQALGQFITERIAAPLGLHSLVDVDRTPLGTADTLGYARNALAPHRVAPVEGKGWTFAAGQLAMSASDLARWDLALLNDTLLTPASRKALTASVTTGEGDAQYGLGLGVETTPDGRLRWSHGGGVGGYMTRNVVYPQQGLAIVVLTNTAGIRLAATLEAALETLLLPPAPAAPPASAQAASGAAPAAAPAPDAGAAHAQRRIGAMFGQLQKGRPERGAMTADLSAFFTAQVVEDYARSLAPLGPLLGVEQLAVQPKGSFTSRIYRLKTKGKDVLVVSYFSATGQLAQFNIF